MFLNLFCYRCYRNSEYFVIYHCLNLIVKPLVQPSIIVQLIIISCCFIQIDRYLFKRHNNKSLRPVPYLPQTKVHPLLCSLRFPFISPTIHAHRLSHLKMHCLVLKHCFFSLHLPFTSFYIIIPECFYFSSCEITMET